MKLVTCLYCEGTDGKLAVLSKNKNGIKIHHVATMTLSKNLQASMMKQDVRAELDGADLLADDEITFDNLDGGGTVASSVPIDQSDVGLLNTSLSRFRMGSMNFIPIVTEPLVNFHMYEGHKDSNKKKLVQAVIDDLRNVKGIEVPEDLIDITELNEKTTLGVFIEGEIPCVGLINQLANYNKKRYLKIPTIKTAELSLAHYVSNSTKFFPDDYSLIVYIGKEYSKLLFMEGQKLAHIGSTLDIGTKNLHTYDVYFSKILLEMENGNIPKLDNIVICGEDRSENLILSFYGTFPEANVSELKFENFETSLLTEDNTKNLALYAIPISAAVEYFDELDKNFIGVNFLPKYIQENQKFLQFGWHSYAVMPFLFGATLFFTINILSNIRKINELDFEIMRLNQRQALNQALIDEINPLTERVNNFDLTQKVLDAASTGSSIWNKTIFKIADFVERRRNFWITKIETVNPEEIKLIGYSLTRSVLTEFASQYESSILKKIDYEPLRDKSAFSFTINLKFNTDSVIVK